MITAKDEQILKEWEYATSTKKMMETKYSLTVTNKRLISQTKSPLKNTHEEIALSSIKSFSATHSTPSKFLAIVLILAGILLIGFPIYTLMKDVGFDNLKAMELGEWIKYLAPCLVGIFLFYLAYLRLCQGTFSLIITTKDVESTPILLGSARYFRRPSLKGSLVGKRKVRLNNAVSEEIVETLGSIIFGK